MIPLRLISVPYIRRHALRTMLMTAGIILGVAVFVGLHTANRGMQAQFRETIDRIAGRTDLQITAGETGFAEDTLELVQSATTVSAAVPVIEAVADPRTEGDGMLLVLGVDMTGDRSVRDYDLNDEEGSIDDPLVFLAQPDSLMLARSFAARHGLTVGSQIVLGTALGDRRFTVRGIMTSSGLASAFGGNLAVMDVYAAQLMFGRGRTFDRIDVALQQSRTAGEAQAELRRLLGPGFQIAPPSGRGEQFEAMTAAYSMMLNISSVFGLFIGMFIVYNSFSTGVRQRQDEIAVLRALGATRAQIAGLFLRESTIIGLAGSAVGIACGLLVSRVIAASIGAVVSDVYGVTQQAAEGASDPVVLTQALLLGVATSVIAALWPAIQAARMEPVPALRKGWRQTPSTGENRARIRAAAVLGALSAGCLTAGNSRLVFYSGYALVVAAALVASPVVSVGMFRVLRPVLKAVRPVEGALAADSLIHAPRRTSASIAALMLSLALVVAFSGIGLASYDSIRTWVDATLNADLAVMPAPTFASRALRFPPEMAEELSAVSGVGRVQAVRNARVVFRQTAVMLIAVDVKSLSETTVLPVVQGDAERMYLETAGGRGVIVSENLAELQGLSLGDTIELAAPRGLIRLPVAGVVVDYSDQQGTIIMDRTVYQTHWRDDSANAFRVFLERGAAADVVKQRILARFAGRRQAFVLTNSQLRDYILEITDQWFALTYVQTAIAVLIAVLGIASTLTVSIIDRRRELAVLKAVGAIRAQIRRTVWIEALCVATLGVVLGCALGAINLYYVLEIVRRDIAGLRLEYQFPTAVALTLPPVILGAALVAAIWPAEAAARGSLVEALEYE